MGDVLMVEMLSAQIEIMCCTGRCGFAVVGKAHQPAWWWRIHMAGVGERLAALFRDGWGHGEGFGGVKDMVIQDAVDVTVEGRLAGVGRSDM